MEQELQTVGLLFARPSTDFNGVGKTTTTTSAMHPLGCWPEQVPAYGSTGRGLQHFTTKVKTIA